MPDADLGRRLLEYLRARLGDPALDFAEAPASVSGGFDTRIFAFRLRGAARAYAGPLILRLFGARDHPARALREAVTQNELDSAREQVKGKLLMSLESSDSLMTRLAKNVIYLGRHQPVENILAGFDAVGIDDVQAMANRLFDGECLNVEVMGKTAGLGLAADDLQF